MYKVGIAGASGYTGYELIKIIHRHSEMEVGWLTSENSAGRTFSDIYPSVWEYPLISLEEAMNRTDEVDVVFLCLPHAASMEAVKHFFGAGLLVMDLSADFRLDDAETYTRWYGVPHTAVELFEQARYGLCEIYREQIKGGRLVAVPGCYPTSVNLGLFPLAQAGWLGEKVIVDAKSGVSGAGRKAKLDYHFVETNENISAYSIGHRHRHIAEMEKVLNGSNGKTKHHRFTFTPHLLPVTRGILSTMYVDVPEGVTQADVRAAYAEAYSGEPFVHVLPAGQSANLAHVANTNNCAIGITPVDPTDTDGTDYVITAAIDNLLKGASGQAVQCFNIVTGLDETTGLF